MARGKSIPLNNATRDENSATGAETSERSMPRDTSDVQPNDKSEFLTSEVDEVIEMIQIINQSEECREQCVEQEEEELIWE